MGLFSSLLNCRYLTKQQQEVKQTLNVNYKDLKLITLQGATRFCTFPSKGRARPRKRGAGTAGPGSSATLGSISLYWYSLGLVEPPRKERQKPVFWFDIAASLGIPSQSASSLIALTSLQSVRAGSSLSALLPQDRRGYTRPRSLASCVLPVLLTFIYCQIPFSCETKTLPSFKYEEKKKSSLQHVLWKKGATSLPS